jgi:hypothetical protein
MRNRTEGAREFRERARPEHPELDEKERKLFEKLMEYCDGIRDKEPDWQKRVVYALEKYKADDYLTGEKRKRFYRLLAAEHARRGREQQKAGRSSAKRQASSRETARPSSDAAFTDEQIRRMVADARAREVREMIRSGELEPPDDRPTKPRREHPDHP